MKKIGGLEAIYLAREVCKTPRGCFTVVFFSYNRTKKIASAKPKTYTNCTLRSQLPQEKFSISSDNFFLFSDENGNPKMCYRVLLRYIAYSIDNFELRKLKWT